MKCCEADPRAHEEVAEDSGHDASRALRRLVGFMASALDVRFAFVVAFHPPAEPRRVGVWLARDYGLRSEHTVVDVPDSSEAARLDFATLFCRVRPHEPELAAIRPGGCVSLPLADVRGRLIGHMGILDWKLACRFTSREPLVPLARRAAVEVERWVASPR